MSAPRVIYVRTSELPLTAARAWLSARELAVWNSIRSEQRRVTWLAGRMVAKRLISALLREADQTQEHFSPTDVTIETRSLRAGHGERPVITLDSQPLPVALSIAHTVRGALVAGARLNAGAPPSAATLGVDLVESGSLGSSLLWACTAREQGWLAEQRDTQQGLARIWAMKEALYKAAQQGEGFTPAEIDVTPGRLPSYPRWSTTSELRCLQTWNIDGHVAALAMVHDRTAGAALELPTQRHEPQHYQPAQPHSAWEHAA